MDTAEGLAGAPTSMYFQVTGRDRRLCPTCGGFFVKRVNTYAAPLLVAAIDYSALGLDRESLLRLRERIESGRGLLRGRIVPRTLGLRAVHVLVASEAWEASSGARVPAGMFYRLQNNNIVCITEPCFSAQAAELNRPFATDVSGIDLTPSGATEEEKQLAYEALGTTTEGFLAAGYIRTVPDAGPGGAGRTLFASQFYLKAAPAN
jgi:hypothetical protein